MRRNIFARRTCYTHPIGTLGIIAAAMIYVGIFLAVMYALTPSFISWVD